MNFFDGQSRSAKMGFALTVAIVLLGALYLGGADAKTIATFAGWLVAIAASVSFIFWAGSIGIGKARSFLLIKGLSKRGAKDGTLNIEEEEAANEIKSKFLEGLSTLKKNDVNLYTIPWYLVIGESGVGKTEAIRRGRLDLIHGLHDPHQGKGGTRDMHWWFTASAVLIDTAGRMVFPEHKTESTPAWCQLLELLKRYRTHCPINGIMLMISAESLLKDDEQSIHAKANKITKEIYSIRDALDLRFPIYVMVTKCDRIPGFNEFFSTAHNCDQMLGWSNPNDSFNPSDVESSLSSMMTAIKERRASLLSNRGMHSFEEDANTAEEKPEAWYAFPNELERTLPNLQRYLRTAFPDEGAFAGKRPFMRGIYFTSAMKEGAAIDIEIAKKFAVDVDELPEEEKKEEEAASYFLRDLFKQKIFKEKGMVTPEMDIRGLVWKRKALTLGFAYVGLLAIGLAAFWAINSLKESIADQQAYWVETAKSNHWLEDETWTPSIVYKNDEGSYYSGEATPLDINGKSISLIEFHQTLNELANQSIELPPILQPISDFTQLEIENTAERQKVQRVVFEKSILKPLYQLAREKLLNETQEAKTPLIEEVLLAMIRIEGALEEKALGGTIRTTPFATDIKHLFSYVTEKNAHLALSTLLQKTYPNTLERAEAWPPKTLSEGINLPDNAPVVHAIDTVIARAEKSGETQKNNLLKIKALAEAIQTYEDVEKRILETLRKPIAFLSFRDYTERVNAVFNAYEIAKIELDERLKEPSVKALTDKPWFAILDAHEKQLSDFNTATVGQLSSLLSKLDAQLGGAGTHLSGSLALDAKNSLLSKQNELFQNIETIFTPRDLAELGRFDDEFLNTYARTDDMLYQHRYSLISLCYFKIVNSDKPWRNLVGQLPSKLRGVKTNYIDSTNSITASRDNSIPGFQSTLTTVIDYLEHVRSNNICTAYLEQAKASLRESIGFPVVLDSEKKPLNGQSVKAFRALIAAIRNDLPPQMLQLFSMEDRNRIDAFITSLDKIEIMLDTFFDEDNKVRTVQIIVPDFFEHKKMLNQHFYLESTDLPFPGDIWKIVQLNTDTPARSDQEKVLGEPSLNSTQFTYNFYRFPKDINEGNPGHSQTYVKKWAPLEHIYDGKTFPSSDYKTWNVPLWIKLDEDTSQPFFIRYEFEHPLPKSKADWPTLTTLNIGH